MVLKIFVMIAITVVMVNGAEPKKEAPKDTAVADTTNKDTTKVTKPVLSPPKKVEKVRLKIDPELKIESSKYVNFTSNTLTAKNGTINFQGDFLVLGEGIFGHFDLQTFDSTGNRLKLAQSEERNYRRDQGSKYKNVSISTTDTDSLQCYKVSVFFHEMRLEPDSGPCKRQ
jgi:hypothetical protein